MGRQLILIAKLFKKNPKQLVQNTQFLSTEYTIKNILSHHIKSIVVVDAAFCF